MAKQFFDASRKAGIERPFDIAIAAGPDGFGTAGLRTRAFRSAGMRLSFAKFRSSETTRRHGIETDFVSEITEQLRTHIREGALHA